MVKFNGVENPEENVCKMDGVSDLSRKKFYGYDFAPRAFKTLVSGTVSGVKGFIYLAEDGNSAPFTFQANTDPDNVWHRQFTMNPPFDSKYEAYTTYTHFTADNTGSNVPNKGTNVYGAGVIFFSLSNSRFFIPKRTMAVSDSEHPKYNMGWNLFLDA